MGTKRGTRAVEETVVDEVPVTGDDQQRLDPNRASARLFRGAREALGLTQEQAAGRIDARAETKRGPVKVRSGWVRNTELSRAIERGAASNDTLKEIFSAWLGLEQFPARGLRKMILDKMKAEDLSFDEVQQQLNKIGIELFGAERTKAHLGTTAYQRWEAGGGVSQRLLPFAAEFIADAYPGFTPDELLQALDETGVLGEDMRVKIDRTLAMEGGKTYGELRKSLTDATELYRDTIEELRSESDTLRRRSAELEVKLSEVERVPSQLAAALETIAGLERAVEALTVQLRSKGLLSDASEAGTHPVRRRTATARR